VTFLDATIPIGSVSLSDGVASLSTSALAAGAHNITARYAGDPNFNGSASSVTNVVVTASSFSLSATAFSPASVLPGGEAQSTITLTPSGGFNPANVNLSCNVSPAVASAPVCLLSVISVTGGVGSSTLTVSTIGRGLAVALQPTERGFSKLAMLALGLPAFFLCGAGMGKSNRRNFIAIGFTCLILVSCMLQTACGGSRRSGGSPETPAGTYTVTVTARGSGIQPTTSVALVVQ
jgi:hypothetical protein